MVKPEELVKELIRDVPEFLDFEEFDELHGILYVEYGRLGTFLMFLLRNENVYGNSIEVIKKIFQHLNSIYAAHKEDVENLIVVSVFEPISESERYIEIVENGFSEELKELFYQKLTSER